MTCDGSSSEWTRQVLFRETHQHFEPPRVFVAEGSASRLELMADMFRVAGCEVIEARDGVALVSELISSLRGSPARAPDLIVVEARLPVWSGLEVLVRLRRFDRITPVILLASPEDRLSTAELDLLAVDVVLHFPFDYAQLLDVAGALLAR